MNIDLQDPVQREEFRKVLREAIDSWLDEQAKAFGKWSWRWLAGSAVALFGYYWLSSHGIKL